MYRFSNDGQKRAENSLNMTVRDHKGIKVLKDYLEIIREKM